MTREPMQGVDRIQTVVDAAVSRPDVKPRLTLEQKLELFDLARHGGEVMANAPVGRECLLPAAEDLFRR